MPVPDNMDVKVVENADDCVHITLPAPPPGMDLSDDDLSNAAGGILAVTSMAMDCDLFDLWPTDDLNAVPLRNDS